MPVQPIEILLGAERREQGLRAGVVVGIVERLHRNLQQDLVALRARPLGQFGGIRAVGRKRQRHRGRQLHDGVGGLGRADPKAADDDRHHGHFGRLGAVGFGGVDRERLQPVRDHGDHAVAGFFQQALIHPGHHGGRGVGLGLVGGVAADHDVLALAAGAVDDGDGLLLGGRGLPGCGFGAGLGGAGSGHGGFLALVRGAAGRAKRDARDRLAAQRIVAEDGEAGEDSQKQAQQNGKCLDTGKRQPETALPARRLLSERRAQIVGRLCHGAPRINRLDDTTTGQGRGRYATRESPAKALNRGPARHQSGQPAKRAARRPPCSQNPVKAV